MNLIFITEDLISAELDRQKFSGNLNWTIDELKLLAAGQFCSDASKPQGSFSERFVTHHKLRYGEKLKPIASDIIITDLMSGKSLELTRSNEQLLALYPHFRTDDWIYFVVNDQKTNVNLAVALYPPFDF